MQISLFKAVLTIFGEGTGASGGDGSAASGDTSTASVAGKQGKGEYANVLFGKQESAPTEEPVQAEAVSEDKADPQKTREERAKAYKDFIAQNKDLYEADFQKVFDKRFKDYKNLQSQVNSQQEIIDRAMSRYGIEGNDLKALSDAMDNDDYYYEKLADEQGLTIEQAKRLEKLQRQNDMLMRTEQQRMAEEEARVQEARQEQQVNQWMEQAKELTAQYPGFDLMQDISDSRFQAMLNSGVPMADAYKAMHFDELMAANSQQIAASTEKAVTSNIRAKGNRPQENGTVSQAGFIVKSDVSKLTKNDRAEVIRRSMRGERITF